MSHRMPTVRLARCAQEVSTAIRVGANPIIFLLNNAYYVIEEEIHQGPYNRLVSWDYTALAHAMSGGSDNLFTAKASAQPSPAPAAP